MSAPSVSDTERRGFRFNPPFGRVFLGCAALIAAAGAVLIVAVGNG